MQINFIIFRSIFCTLSFVLYSLLHLLFYTAMEVWFVVCDN